jgi:enoyl-ACP reductase-like protein
VSVLVYEPPGQVEIEALEDELARALDIMREAVERGDAVVVSLDEAHVQGVGDVADAALARGLLGLTRALAIEGRPPEVYAKLVARVPAGRAAAPAEVADVVTYLASERASYVTGQMLLACGGRSVGG